MRASIILALLCAGCVVNSSAVRHCTYDRLTGALTEKTVTHTTTVAALGSKEGLATGSVTLRIKGEYYKVGQNSSGLEAGGDPVAFAGAIAPFATSAATPELGLGKIILKELWR